MRTKCVMHTATQPHTHSSMHPPSAHSHPNVTQSSHADKKNDGVFDDRLVVLRVARVPQPWCIVYIQDALHDSYTGYSWPTHTPTR